MTTQRVRSLAVVAAVFAGLVTGGTPLAAAVPDKSGVQYVTPDDSRMPRGGTDRSTAPASAVPPSCDGDGVSGARVAMLYVRGDAQPDRFAALRSTFVSYAAGINGQFVRSSEFKGGHREVRFVHDTACTPTVIPVVIPQSSIGDVNKIKDSLVAQGYNRTNRKYLIWAETTQYCGIAPGYAIDDRPGQDNANNTGSGWAIVGLSQCFSAGVALHELLHVLGAVQRSAPSSTGAHCYLIGDVMCYDDGGIPTPPGKMIDCPIPGGDWIDCTGDMYFNPVPKPGGYLSGHWNTANSVFLITKPASQPIPATAVLFNPASGWVADVDREQTANGTKAKAEKFNGRSAQQWNLTRLDNGKYRIAPVIAPDKTLDFNVSRDIVQDGTRFFTHIWTNYYSINQQWTLRPAGDGLFEIVGNDGYADACLHAQSHNTALRVWTCDGSPQQRWRLLHS